MHLYKISGTPFEKMKNDFDLKLKKFLENHDYDDLDNFNWDDIFL